MVVRTEKTYIYFYDLNASKEHLFDRSSTEVQSSNFISLSLPSAANIQKNDNKNTVLLCLT